MFSYGWNPYVCLCACSLLREETENDEGTEEAAPPHRVHADSGGGVSACWAPAAPSWEAPRREEADARRSASTYAPPQGHFIKKSSSTTSRNHLILFFQIGQDRSSGVQPRPAVIHHRLYFQIPHDPQNSVWLTVQSTFLISVPKWRLSFHFSTEDMSWPTLAPSPDCCPRWPLLSTLPPSSSMTSGLRFFWKSCHGLCQLYAAALWTWSYPYMLSLCLTTARSAQFCGGGEGFSAICSP